MSEAIAARLPGWFRLLSVLALPWSAIGFALHLQKLALFGIRWPAFPTPSAPSPPASPPD